MPVIVDTSIVIGAAERHDEMALRGLERCGSRTQRSMIVLGELHAGVSGAKRQGSSAAAQEERLATLNAYLQISEEPQAYPRGEIAEAFGDITGICAEAGLKVGQNDRWILAEGLALGLSVVTLDDAQHELGRLIDQRFERESPLTLHPAHSAQEGL